MVDPDAAYEALMGHVTSPEHIKESSAFPTLRDGTYKLEIEKKEVRTASDASPWPGRLMIHCQARVSDLQTGEPRGVQFFDVSPVENRTESGRFDGPYQLWCQVISARGLEGQSNAAVLDALDSYPFKSRIAEAFQVPNPNTGESRWRSASNEEERAKFAAAGYAPKNFVRSLGRLF